MQNLQLYRGKKGMDTMFDHNEELMHQLRLFLEIHELWRQIDPDSPSASRVLEGYREIPNDYPREQMTDQQKFFNFVGTWPQSAIAIKIFCCPITLSDTFFRRCRSNSKPSSLESVRVSLLRQWLQGLCQRAGSLVEVA